MAVKYNAVRQYLPGEERIDHLKTIPFEKCQEMVGGDVEVHNHGGLQVVCNESGRILQLRPSANIEGTIYVGKLLVGHFTDNGLEPATPEEIEAFEKCVLCFY